MGDLQWLAVAVAAVGPLTVVAWNISGRLSRIETKLDTLPCRNCDFLQKG